LGRRGEHVIKQRAGIWKDDAFDAAVADVAFVPKGDIFESRNRVAANHTRKAGHALPGNWVAFVWHGARAFLTLGEEFFGFENFSALKMTKFGGPTFDARSNKRQVRHKFGVNVALHNLRGDGRGLQAEFLADKLFDIRIEVRAGADCAGNLADGGPRAGDFEAFLSPAKFVIHQREF